MACSPLGTPIFLSQVNYGVREDVARVLRAGVGHIRPHQAGREQVPLRVRRRGVAKHGGSVHDDAHAVRNDWVVVGVSVRDVLPHHAGDRIRHPVRQVAAGVPKSDARERRGEHHVGPGLDVVGGRARR